MSEFFSVAVDGPAGAGKSTLARAASARFGFLYADTGAIYRTVGLAVYRAGLDSGDQAGVSALLPGLDVHLRHGEDGLQHMFLGDEDVSEAIRLPGISLYASDISAMPPVRTFLLDMQRELARRHNVIMDGRDIGTVVLPDADLKVFLTAAPEVRARRRLLELEARGLKTSLEEVLHDMEYRDANDAARATAPLRAAPDAILLDTTQLTLDESVDELCRLIGERWRP